MKFQSGESKTNFLKLQDGESVVGVLRGDVYEFRQHWKDGKSTLCLGSNVCEYCEVGSKPGFRFRVNFITWNGQAYDAWLFEQGWKVYQQLKALHEGDYNLENHWIKITRTGLEKMTSYTIVPVPYGQLKPEQDALVKQVHLHLLEHPKAQNLKFDVETIDNLPF